MDKAGTGLTLERAIDMGEYDPSYLSKFEQWRDYSKHMQFELVKKGLANRRRLLLRQWMDVESANDFTKKPHLIEASKSILKQVDALTKEKERLYALFLLELG